MILEKWCSVYLEWLKPDEWCKHKRCRMSATRLVVVKEDGSSENILSKHSSKQVSS